MTKLKDLRKLIIDRRNRKRLTNTTPTLISSNCAAGMIYHWLGLRFHSPFINLWMTNDDFLTAMENFDDFLSTPLSEDKSGIRDYPVGLGYKGTRVFFLHYGSWQEAIAKWEQRISRIQPDNMAIILSNFKGVKEETASPEDILYRFDRLPFANKIAFTDRPYPQYPWAVHLPGYRPDRGMNVFDTRPLARNRYIDSFDYVRFINSLRDS